MKYSKISIITPSFNQKQYLEQTILSVLNQNYPNLEYIIIDGGSTDGSVEIIKKYEKHLTYWISEKDSGQSEAINKGLKKATGEIVAWLNSDDLYFNDTLITIEKMFSENIEIDLIYGDVENFYSDGRNKLFINKEFDPVDFLSRVSVHQPSVFWKRKIHNEIGYLDESLHYLMDYDLWMRIFFTYKTKKMNNPLSKFRIHNNSKTSSNPKELYLEYRKVVSRFFNSFENNEIVEKLKRLDIYQNEGNGKYNIRHESMNNKTIRNSISNYIFNCAVHEYTFGSRKKTNHLLLKCLKSNRIEKAIFFLIKNNLLKD